MHSNNDIAFQRAAIEAALDYIDPDKLSRDEWLRVLMALHSEDMPIILAEEWSAKKPLCTTSQWLFGRCSTYWLRKI